MVIRNLSKQYRVIREWKRSDDIVQYTCREEEEQRDCSVAVQSLKQISGEEVRFLMAQVNNSQFQDFIDFFTDAQNLYVVTSWSREKNLKEKLEESCSLKERMEIGKNLLEYMVLFDIPSYFVSRAMEMELVTVSASLEIRLNYDLSDLPDFGQTDFQKAAEKLGDILGQLYEEELSIRAFPPMETCIYDMKNGGFSSILEIYGRFQGIYREWADKKKEQLEPESLPFRLWKKIKAAGNLGKKAAALAIVLLAIAYLAVSIQQLFKEPGTAVNYSQIGTLKIQNGNLPAEGGQDMEVESGTQEETGE